MQLLRELRSLIVGRIKRQRSTGEVVSPGLRHGRAVAARQAEADSVPPTGDLGTGPSRAGGRGAGSAAAFPGVPGVRTGLGGDTAWASSSARAGPVPLCSQVAMAV